MFSPKEEQADYYMVWIGIACILVAVSTIIMTSSFSRGSIYLMLQIDSIETTGAITEAVKYRTIFTYTDQVGDLHSAKINRSLDGVPTDLPLGTKVPVVYNPDHPEYFLSTWEIEGAEFSFQMLVGAIIIILITGILSIISVIKYVNLKQKMKYY